MRARNTGFGLRLRLRAVALGLVLAAGVAHGWLHDAAADDLGHFGAAIQDVCLIKQMATDVPPAPVAAGSLGRVFAPAAPLAVSPPRPARQWLHAPPRAPPLA